MSFVGAGSGIGQGAAVRFAGFGCRLALTGRNAERLYHTADLCCKAGATTEKVSKVFRKWVRKIKIGDRIISH